MANNQADKPWSKNGKDSEQKGLRFFIEELDPQEKNEHQTPLGTNRLIDEQNKMIDRYNLRK
ncbi:hypothetical protein [Paenibacillus puerhi]|uniref:hypothetical protein n=1 Tax=Paenibacillus puerhi TaxID=2692622 RepID=UPI00135BC1DB|nr:hypothetical protein [Paenibacillus puerhi]